MAYLLFIVLIHEYWKAALHELFGVAK